MGLIYFLFFIYIFFQSLHQKGDGAPGARMLLPAHCAGQGKVVNETVSSEEMCPAHNSRGE